MVKLQAIFLHVIWGLRGVLIDAVCPICYNTFLSILAEEETARAMDSPAHPVEELGVTKLERTCGHLFCRKELSEIPFLLVRPC